MYYLQHYKINWDLVKTFEDLKLILKAMGITFEQNYANLEEVMPYCDLVEKDNGFTFDKVV